jgi:hypothetical protein
MSEIQISLSRKHARLLLKHVFIGDWILTASKVERDKELDDFYDTFLSLAQTHNMSDDLAYSESLGGFALSREKEDEFLECIREYEEESFWDDLVARLSARDAEEKAGTEAFEAMEGQERMKAVWKEEEKYAHEFDTNGIQRLRIAR